MNDFVANRVIEDYVCGKMSAQEAWSTVKESRHTITDEKYDEIVCLITEDLVSQYTIEEDIEELDLDQLFSDDSSIDLERCCDYDSTNHDLEEYLEHSSYANRE